MVHVGQELFSVLLLYRDFQFPALNTLSTGSGGGTQDDLMVWRLVVYRCLTRKKE